MSPPNSLNNLEAELKFPTLVVHTSCTHTATAIDTGTASGDLGHKLSAVGIGVPVVPCGGYISFDVRTCISFPGEILIMKRTPNRTWEDET